MVVDLVVVGGEDNNGRGRRQQMQGATEEHLCGSYIFRLQFDFDSVSI